jgi:ATP-binding cassette subfamily B protein
MPRLFTRANPSTARKTLRLFRSEMARDKRLVAFYSTIIPLHQLAFMVILPLLFSLIIQSLTLDQHNWQYPTLLLGFAAIASAVSMAFSHVGFDKLFRHQEAMRTRLTERAMNALVHHSDQFFANRKVGALAGDVNTFSHSIITLLDIVFINASGLIVNFVFSLIVVAFVSPALLLPLAAATVLLIWRSIVGVNARSTYRNKRKILSSQLNGTIADILGNNQVVRYFSGSKREVRRIVRDRRDIESIAHKEISIVQREMLTRQGVLMGFQLITIAACIWLFTNGMASIAALVFAVTYLGRLTGAMFQISPIIRNIEQMFIDSANITEILDERAEVQDKKDSKKLAVTKGSIELKNVEFHYPDHDEQVVAIDNLTIAAGERIGLAGHSGGGKTTLTKLLLRFSDVTGGAITIDSQDIKNVTQESLRSAIAYVPQEPYLFHRSLRDNIAYARPKASDAEVWKAVKQANAYEFVKKLPEGLDTVVGERGVKLSGGQRQRIAIARAILKDAPILVLDEATSALDSESEKQFQSALEKLM